MARKRKSTRPKLGLGGLGLEEDEDKILERLIKEKDISIKQLVRKLIRKWIHENIHEKN